MCSQLWDLELGVENSSVRITVFLSRAKHFSEAALKLAEPPLPQSKAGESLSNDVRLHVFNLFTVDLKASAVEKDTFSIWLEPIIFFTNSCCLRSYRTDTEANYSSC